MERYVILEKKQLLPMLGEQQLEEGDFYLSPEGYKVFTEQFHLKRGYCCESGCRHCPFGFNQNKKRH